MVIFLHFHKKLEKSSSNTETSNFITEIAPPPIVLAKSKFNNALYTGTHPNMKHLFMALPIPDLKKIFSSVCLAMGKGKYRNGKKLAEVITKKMFPYLDEVMENGRSYIHPLEVCIGQDLGHQAGNTNTPL